MLEINKEYLLSDLKFSGVYKIQNKLNSKCYIGSSKHIIIRLFVHIKRSHNFLLRKAFRKYKKENFTFTILELVSDISKLKERESYYINLYESNSSEKGYNIAIIGEAIKHELCNESNKNNNKSSRTKDFYNFNKINKLPTRALVKGASIRIKLNDI